MRNNNIKTGGKDFMDKLITAIGDQDVVDAVATSVLEQIPVINFFISAVDKVKNVYLQRKLENWREMVGERLSTVEDVVLEQLGENETFATTFMKATELAAQANQKKMELLANAVKYSARNRIEDDYLILYLNYIAKYTITHLIVLKYFQSPNRTPNTEGIISSSPLSLFTDVFPDIDKDVVKIAAKDLHNDGLMSISDLGGTMTKEGCLASRTTRMGNSFIDFLGIKEVEL